MLSSDRTTARPGILALLVAALAVCAFVVGRATAPSNGPDVVQSDCLDIARTGIALPDGGTGYFSQCDSDAELAASLRNQRAARPLEIYAADAGDEVIAWFYIDCGMPEGIVQPDSPHPEGCGSTDTTSGS